METGFLILEPPQQPLEPKCPFIFILVFVSITDNNKNRLAPNNIFSGNSGEWSSGRQSPLLGEEEAPFRGTQGPPWLSSSPASSELVDINRQHFLGFQDFNFPCFIPPPPTFYFFPFLKIIKLAENWPGLVDTEQGGIH